MPDRSRTLTTPSRPPAWDLLAQAITTRCSVRASYHGHDRTLCPHLLGWKNGRALTLCYQSAGSTSRGSLGRDHQRWRWMFVDEIHDAVMTDTRWQTAPNYNPDTAPIDIIEHAAPADTTSTTPPSRR